MKWLWLSRVFFALLLFSACSSDEVINCSSDKAINCGQDKINEADSKNKNTLHNKVIVLCRCGKGHVSWSGEDESSAKEVVRKNCESLSQSIRDCRVKEQ